MRVLMMAWEYPPHIVGGMGKHVADIVPALDAAGIEVHVVTPLMSGGDEHSTLGNHSHIYRVATPSMPDYGFITFNQETNRHLEGFARELAEQVGGFDLIHCHDWLTAYSSVALKYHLHVPLVSTIHATERGRGRGILFSEQSQKINSIEWWLIYESWRVIVCSEFMRDQLVSSFSTPYDKMDVVPNGVHIVEHTWTDEERSEFRRKYAADDEKIVFSVARIVHEKGIHVLVEAIPRVLAQRGDVKFVIAGLGPMQESLKQRTSSMGLDQRVFWTGFISDQERDRLYSVADVAVFPSLYEPFGIVALEAMAAKCPVVVSETGGLREVVQLHETGLTVHPDNPDSLAWGILHTLAEPEWSQKRVANAFRCVQDVYNWEHIAQETIETYQKVYDDFKSGTW